MAYLHKGDLKQTTIFSFDACLRDSVFLLGMQEGESIQSINPYFFQNADGYLAIDDRFTSLRIVKNGELVQTIDISWEKSCTIQTEILPTNKDYAQGDGPLFQIGFGSILVLSAGMLVVMISRRFQNAKK
jgi:hypothetical protein